MPTSVMLNVKMASKIHTRNTAQKGVLMVARGVVAGGLQTQPPWLGCPGGTAALYWTYWVGRASDWVDG